jgi:hypothetical protein
MNDQVGELVEKSPGYVRACPLPLSLKTEGGTNRASKNTTPMTWEHISQSATKNFLTVIRLVFYSRKNTMSASGKNYWKFLPPLRQFCKNFRE